jgi:arsenate reductase
LGVLPRLQPKWYGFRYGPSETLARSATAEPNLRLQGWAQIRARATRRFPAVFTAMLKIYVLSNCDSCRRALQWLREHKLEFEEHAIRETPPAAGEIKKMLAACDGEVRRLFNTSGRDYREQKLGTKVGLLTESEAITLLTENGNLVKRPFLLGDKVALVGFDEAVWGKALL